MAAALLDCVRAANCQLEIALSQADDPAFDVHAVDLNLVRRLRACLSDVARASAEASAEERERARADADYRDYLKRLARLGAAVEAWHGRLLAHRARLDRDGERLHAARCWAEAYNRTR